MDNYLFDIKKFDLLLETEWVGRNFIYVDEVDSTNSYLLKNADELQTNGTIVFAEHQTAGKGRMNRSWTSTHGENLTFSILINQHSLLKNINFINFGCSLAISSSIANLYQLKTQLKWPNDVLINKKKVSGILLESVSEADKIKHLVIGIGLNTNQMVFTGKYITHPTSVRLEAGKQIEREKLLAEVLNVLEENLQKIKKSPKSILSEWRKNCSTIGDRITIQQGDTTKSGIFDDIDDEGYLLLKTGKKIEKISLGDVSTSG